MCVCVCVRVCVFDFYNLPLPPSLFFSSACTRSWNNVYKNTHTHEHQHIHHIIRIDAGDATSTQSPSLKTEISGIAFAPSYPGAPACSGLNTTRGVDGMCVCVMCVCGAAACSSLDSIRGAQSICVRVCTCACACPSLSHTHTHTHTHTHSLTHTHTHS